MMIKENSDIKPQQNKLYTICYTSYGCSYTNACKYSGMVSVSMWNLYIYHNCKENLNDNFCLKYDYFPIEKYNFQVMSK